MPWYGWLIAAAISAVVLIYLLGFVLFAAVWRGNRRNFDRFTKDWP